MSRKRLFQNSQSGLGWWTLLIIFGFGLLFLFVQTPNLPLSNNASINPEAQPDSGRVNQVMGANSLEEQQEENIDNSEVFLAEYDAAADSYLNSETEQERPLWQVSVDLGLKLVIVIGLIYAAIAGLRWLQGNRHKMAGGAGSAIRILETTNLAPNRALHVVVVGEKTLLIGATDHQLSLLAELPDAITPLPDELLVQPEQPPGFDQTLDWQVTLGGLRTNIQHIRETIGGRHG